jgi:hypothetical protein
VEPCAAASTRRLQRVGGPGSDASEAPSSQITGRHTIGAKTGRAMTINDVTVVSVPASDPDRARPSTPAPSASSSPATTTQSPDRLGTMPPARCKGWSYAPMTSTRLPAAARRRRTVRRTPRAALGRRGRHPRLRRQHDRPAAGPTTSPGETRRTGRPDTSAPDPPRPPRRQPGRITILRCGTDCRIGRTGWRAERRVGVRST